MTSSYIPPYISVGEFARFISSLRARKPDPITLKILQDIGVSKSNSYTLFGSLVRMGIYDEDGNLLQRDDLIGLSSRDERIKRETFERILKRTYADVMNAIPVEEATVSKVTDFFERNRAAAAPALKGARLFIWIANQAGCKTAEVEFTPYNLDGEKPQKAKEPSDEKTKKHQAATKTTTKKDSMLPLMPKKDSDYEEVYLNILLEKIRTSEGLPSEAVMEQVSKLIESQKSKSHHASIPESNLPRKENRDA